MYTNLNNIPLEILLDYITEITGQEWTLEHILTLALYMRYVAEQKHNYGFGYSQICIFGGTAENGQRDFGNGMFYNYALESIEKPLLNFTFGHGRHY